MKQPVTQSLYAYWDAQRRGRCAPNRHELDPAEMRGFLPHTFMLEVNDRPGIFPIRISGTRLDALMGRDLKGQAFPELWADGCRGEVLGILADVVEEARPVVAAVHGAPDGYAPTFLEMLVLPLRHHGRTHARLLCSLVPVTTPAWLGLRPVSRFTLSGWRSVDPRSEPASARNSAGGLRREHLVVYQGGRAGEAASVPIPQVGVKAPVPRWPDMLLTTRRS